MNTAPSPVLAACIAEFRKTKAAYDACLAQLSDEELHVRINPLQNSVAVILQHVAGNQRSRWTNFLNSDGEKPDRVRESEFEERRRSRSELMAIWEDGWRCLFNALTPLSDADLSRVVTIRNEPHTVILAIARQLAHYGLHLGQVQLIGKHLRGDAWNYLSIPPGKSEEFNKKMGVK